MNFKRFTLPDGTTDCFVNLDQIVAAKPAAGGKVSLHSPSMTVEVDARQFEEAVSEKASKTDSVSPMVNRLIQSIDRLSVRIPSSIRLHV